MSNLPDLDWEDNTGTLYIDDACQINFGGTPPRGCVRLVEQPNRIAGDQLPGFSTEKIKAEARYRVINYLQAENERLRNRPMNQDDFDRGKELGRKHGEEQWAKQFDAARERDKARFGEVPFPTLTQLINSYLGSYHDGDQATLQADNERLRTRVSDIRSRGERVVTGLEKKLSDLRSENANLHNKIEELNTRNNDLESKNRCIQADNCDLRIQLQAEGPSAELTSKNLNLQAANTTLQDRVSSLESRNAALATSHLMQAKKLESLRRVTKHAASNAQDIRDSLTEVSKDE